MRICVENGTFTVAFLKEGMAKVGLGFLSFLVGRLLSRSTQFRGWIDDLLKTSWEACQGTDVLIESPSAMGGYHIAEALKIPYFRAFTMTWTRTRSVHMSHFCPAHRSTGSRAYPHAFAVPEHKVCTFRDPGSGNMLIAPSDGRQLQLHGECTLFTVPSEH